MKILDRKFRAPRMWSNKELKKFSALFSGKVANVSGWRDSDKEGAVYRAYFPNADEYWITNYRSEARGFQGDQENEIFLDLSIPLKDSHPTFDVVFNHTVMEHIFELDTAFSNLCKLSKDVVILVVPFLQEQHADYGDYWRFTPQAVDKLLTKNGLTTIYLNSNDSNNSSIYVFAIGSRFPERWAQVSADERNMLHEIYGPTGFIGTKVIRNPLSERLFLRFTTSRSAAAIFTRAPQMAPKRARKWLSRILS